MPSRTTLARQALAVEINRSGKEMAPCYHCRAARPVSGQERPKCVVGVRSRKCSECVRKGYKDCDATLSVPEWTKYRDTRDKLQRELDSMEEREVELLHEQSRLQQRLLEHKAKRIRLRKQLRLASGRTESAVEKELEELERAEAGEDEEPGVETLPSTQTPDIWQMSALEWEQICDPLFDWSVPPVPADLDSSIVATSSA